MVANLALFSEIANQFANIRFGDIVKTRELQKYVFFMVKELFFRL